MERLSGWFGWCRLKADEITYLIDCHSNPLTEEDLQEMTISASEEEDESATDEELAVDVTIHSRDRGACDGGPQELRQQSIGILLVP
ncbi:uncharacterized protein LOC144209878 [Stigmatopora nigra]